VSVTVAAPQAQRAVRAGDRVQEDRRVQVERRDGQAGGPLALPEDGASDDRACRGLDLHGGASCPDAGDEADESAPEGLERVLAGREAGEPETVARAARTAPLTAAGAAPQPIRSQCDIRPLCPMFSPT
jgi:hypothetical protein